MQKEEFLRGEGDAYFARNLAHLRKLHADALENPNTDPILRALLPLKPASVLEVGCANGWRLDVMRQLWGTNVQGIDPSEAAVRNGYDGVNVGTADALPNGPFDCVVFGFCLYLCDRSDLFRIACEADRVLSHDGYIVVYDFFATGRNPYSHREGVFSHKMDHSKLWSWHPAYTLWSHEVTAHVGKSPDDPNERLAVTVLKKII